MTEMIGVPESRSGRTPERRRMARETEEARRMIGRSEARTKGGTISGTVVGRTRNKKACRTAGGRRTGTSYFLTLS